MNTTKILLNENWKFHLGEAEEAWYKGYDDSGWKEVCLPHDWSVTRPFSQLNSSGTGYLDGGIGWYRLHFSLPEEYRGKQITLCFEGVYKNSQVWCNSYYLGKRPNGYVPFSYDITRLARFGTGENEVSVKVTHTDLADSRWFTGSGITREVSVLVEEPVHPTQGGIFFSTLSVDEENGAHIRLSHELANQTDRKVSVRVTSCLTESFAPHCGRTSEQPSASGDVSPSPQTAFQADCAAVLEPGETRCLTVEGFLKEPKLWSPQSPFLYQLATSLSVDGDEPRQVYEAPVGIRTFSFDADKGFFLNGTGMKLKGVCVHHDAGCLGAAVTGEIWERRLLLLKEMGCNAIRTSHNPHTPALYDLCDKMGFLVMDEAFDEWENAKNKWSTGHNVYPPKHQGYFEDFPEWHEKDLTAMVLRDRNHPCVILWSIGNEIDYPNDPYCHPLFSTMTGNNDANKPEAERAYNPDRPNMERLAPIAGKLADIVRSLDTTRPITLAAAFPELSSRLAFFDALDVVGYNYKEHLYEEDHRRFPALPILGSENGHSLKDWRAVTENAFISGQFLWTGIDYLGEAHGWPVHGSGAGLLTLAGFPKSRYYRRQTFWTDAPVLKLFTCPYDGNTQEWLPASPSWNYREGEKILVRCCTNLPRVELFLNGKSCGEKTELNEEGYMDWILTCEPGELRADAWTEDGESHHCLIKTAGEAALISLNRWEPSLYASREAGHIEQIELMLTDREGLPAAREALSVTVRVSGEGTLLGLENGDLADVTPYTEHTRKTLEGRLIAYVRRNGPGSITLTASANGLEEASITF